MEKVTPEIYRKYLINRLESLEGLGEESLNTATLFDCARQIDYIMKELYLLDNKHSVPLAYETDPKHRDAETPLGELKKYIHGET